MKISPSVLSCDFRRFGEEIEAMQRAGADMIHLDVMDGRFVPNLTFGAPVIRKLRPAASIPFDVHLMISEPLRYVGDFADAGADIITFHLESDGDAHETIARIRSHGRRAGISIKPKTPALAVFPYLPLVDMVLVMTVEPGFGGQSFMTDQMSKLAAVRDEARRLGLAVDLQVDGGIDNTTAPIAARNGANVLVAGSALYGRPDYAAAVRELRETALAAL